MPLLPPGPQQSLRALGRDRRYPGRRGGRVRRGAGGQLRGVARARRNRGRHADRAAVLRGARLRRAAQPTRRARVDLRRRDDGPDDARAGQAGRRGKCRRRRRERRRGCPWPESSGCSTAVASADEIERPYGWELVVDATGNANAIQDGLGRVGPGGTFLQFGVADYAARATIEPYKIYNKEITITGSMAVLHSYERAADLFADRRPRPGDLHHRPAAFGRIRGSAGTVPQRRRSQDPSPALTRIAAGPIRPLPATFCRSCSILCRVHDATSTQ